MTALRVGPYTGSAEQWDEFVRGAAGWTHFHLHGWRAVMRDVFGHDCPYLVASGTGDRIEGVLPLVRVRSVLFGHFLVSMPFLNYGGPLGSSEAVGQLAGAAREMAERDRATLLELRSRIPLDVSLPVSHRKITVVLDISGGHEAAWKKLDSKLRSQVRRPQKEGVTVRFGHQEVGAFFDVFARHMRDLGTPTQPRSLFEQIARVFPEDVVFGTAYLNEEPVAVGCGFQWGDEFEMTWASSLIAHKKLAPNMYLYWAFIEHVAGRGARKFNFGRCTPGSGTHRFKRQWGGEDEQLWWYQHSRDATSSTPSPDDGAYSWGPKLWRKLPLPVASLLGPRIVRFIP